MANTTIQSTDYSEFRAYFKGDLLSVATICGGRGGGRIMLKPPAGCPHYHQLMGEDGLVTDQDGKLFTFPLPMVIKRVPRTPEEELVHTTFQPIMPDLRSTTDVNRFFQYYESQGKFINPEFTPTANQNIPLQDRHGPYSRVRNLLSDYASEEEPRNRQLNRDRALDAWIHGAFVERNFRSEDELTDAQRAAADVHYITSHSALRAYNLVYVSGEARPQTSRVLVPSKFFV
jgi:hypothetical protein